MDKPTGFNANFQENAPPPSFWRSRAGAYLIIAGALAAGMLVFEHRVHILGSDWLLLLPLFACLAMHFFMHGNHGGHHGGKSGSDKS